MMKEIIINWTYYYDKIVCPSFVVDNLENYQTKFDAWISNPVNKHEYWECLEDGEMALSFDTDAFVNWLNDYVIIDDEKAYFLQRNMKKSVFKKKFKIPVINF